MNEVVAFARVFSRSGTNPDEARNALRRLRRPASTVESVGSVLEQFSRIDEAVNGDQAGFFRFLRHPEFENVVALAAERRHPERAFLAHSGRHFTEERLNPRVLLTGNDLIQIFDLRPGPVFRDILFALETAQLNEEVETRDDAVEFVTNFIASGDE